MIEKIKPVPMGIAGNVVYDTADIVYTVNQIIDHIQTKDIDKPRGEWQKEFVGKLIKLGITNDQAMTAMGFVAEEREVAYMQGYNTGYDNGKKTKKVF